MDTDRHEKRAFFSQSSDVVTLSTSVSHLRSEQTTLGNLSAFIGFPLTQVRSLIGERYAALGCYFEVILVDDEKTLFRPENGLEIIVLIGQRSISDKRLAVN